MLHYKHIMMTKIWPIVFNIFISFYKENLIIIKYNILMLLEWKFLYLSHSWTVQIRKFKLEKMLKIVRPNSIRDVHDSGILRTNLLSFSETLGYIWLSTKSANTVARSDSTLIKLNRRQRQLVKGKSGLSCFVSIYILYIPIGPKTLLVHYDPHR